MSTTVELHASLNMIPQVTHDSSGSGVIAGLPNGAKAPVHRDVKSVLSRRLSTLVSSNSFDVMHHPYMGKGELDPSSHSLYLESVEYAYSTTPHAYGR